MNTTKKTIIKPVLSLALLVITIIGLVSYAIPTYEDALSVGASIGNSTGSIVGNFIGSYNGITEGLGSGAEAGKEEGLSAIDTEAKIRSRFVEVGKLEVLEAGIKLTNVSTLGENYANLSVLKGVAVYSIDLDNVDLEFKDSNEVLITLPDIDVEVFIDENATEKLAEYQKYKWTGGIEDGFTMYLNSRKELDNKTLQEMENYKNLNDSAKSSAVKQVEIIAKAATGNDKKIAVLFKDDKE